MNILPRKKQITGSSLDVLPRNIELHDVAKFRNDKLLTPGLPTDLKIDPTAIKTNPGLNTTIISNDMTDIASNAATKDLDPNNMTKELDTNNMTKELDTNNPDPNAALEEAQRRNDALIKKETKDLEAERARNATPEGQSMFVDLWLGWVTKLGEAYLTTFLALKQKFEPLAFKIAKEGAETEVKLENIVANAKFEAENKLHDAEFQKHMAAQKVEGVKNLPEEGTSEWNKLKDEFVKNLVDFVEVEEKKKEAEEKKAEAEAKKKEGGGKKGWFSGGGKPFSLNQIQKGGRQSAKRTKKSINEFLNSSVTSSQILNMIAKSGDDKRKTKVKRKRNNGRVSKKVKKGNK